MKAAVIRRRFLDYFAERGHREVPSFIARPRGRSYAAVHQRRHGAVQAHLPGPGAPRLRAGHHGPEVRARRRQAQRPRAGGPHDPASHVLRDAGELLVRRLLQARCDRIRLGVRDQPEVARHRPRAAAGHRCITPTTRRARSGARSRACPTTGSTAWATRTTSGRWATPARAGRAARSTSTSNGQPGQKAATIGKDEFEDLAEAGRFLEIWNLVFMQFDRSADGTLTPLPKPSVDTGAGLERIAAIMQGEDSNFHTDLFLPLLKQVEELVGQPVRSRPGGRVVPRAGRPCARRELPARRRLLSRATKAGATWCGASCAARCGTPGCWAGASRRSRRSRARVIEQLGEVYPELVKSAKTIHDYVEAEERSFLATIEGGLGRMSELLAAGATVIPGDEAFKLYDTYGFPIDLTVIIAEENGASVDLAGFEAALAAQRKRSRDSRLTTRCTLSTPRPCTSRERRRVARPARWHAGIRRLPARHGRHRAAGLPPGGRAGRAAAAREPVLRRVGRPGQRHRPACMAKAG